MASADAGAERAAADPGMLIHAIAHACLEKSDVEMDDVLVARVLRATLLQRPEFVQDGKLAEGARAELVDTVAEQLQTTDVPALETLKMQTAYEATAARLKEKERKRQTRSSERIAPIVEGIVNARTVTKDSLEALYRQIVTYCLLYSRMGGPADATSVREATAALASVFPQAELPTFMAFSQPEKEAQLLELARVVTGVRLFNRDIGRGGQHLPDVPTECVETAGEVLATTRDEGSTLRTVIEEYTRVLRNMHEMAEYPLPEDPAVAAEFAAARAPGVVQRRQRLRDEMTNRTQLLHYLTSIHDEAERRRADVDVLVQQFDAFMAELRDAVRSRTAVPTDQVFPIFVSLAQVWEQLRDLLLSLQSTAAVLSAVVGFSESFNPTLRPDDTRRAQRQEEMRDKQDAPEEAPGVLSAGAKLVQPPAAAESEAVAEYQTTFARSTFAGFCLWSLANRDGLLDAGDPDAGILVIDFLPEDRRTFAFAQAQAAAAAAADPVATHAGALKAMRQSPELLTLLRGAAHLDDLPALDAIVAGESAAGAAVLVGAAAPRVVEKVNVECATPLHFEETMPTREETRDYTWNEWELRRRALQLAELKNRRTRSSQTGRSHFRRDNATQHYAPKDQGVQTSASAGTAPMRRVRHVGGLRGAPGQRAHVVTIELDV